MLSRDLIKYLAILAMLINHIVRIFPTSNALLNEALTDIGYFTAVTMCFFLVEGYAHTRSRRSYALRLLAFALLSQLPYQLAFPDYEPVQLNMLFTLLLCFLILLVQERLSNPFQRQLFCALLILASAFCDWGFLAPIFTIFFAGARGSRTELKAAFLKSYALFALISTAEWMQTMALPSALLHGLLSGIGILLSAFVLLFLYNGRRTKHGRVFSKWFFYVFYPAHLAVLALLSGRFFAS